MFCLPAEISAMLASNTASRQVERQIPAKWFLRHIRFADTEISDFLGIGAADFHEHLII